MGYVAVIAYLVEQIGTFLNSVAYIYQKIGFLEVEKNGLNGTKSKLPFFTARWLKGFVLLFFGSIFHLIALPYCALVVLSTSSATMIVFNTFLSVYFLDEKFDWKQDGPSLTLIIGGCLAIVFLSSYESVSYTPDIIRELIFSETMFVFMIFFAVVIAVTVFNYVWHSKQVKKFNKSANAWADKRITSMVMTDKEIKVARFAVHLQT